MNLKLILINHIKIPFYCKNGIQYEFVFAVAYAIKNLQKEAKILMRVQGVMYLSTLDKHGKEVNIQMVHIIINTRCTHSVTN